MSDAPETVCVDGTWYDRRDTVDALTSLLADERGKVIDWERRYGAQAAEYKLARERLIALADECIADREKVAAMMMRVSIATGHGDTIDALLTELEGAIVALQVKEENAYESGYEHGHADATREAIESDLRLRNAASRAEEQIEKAAARRRAQEKEDDR